MTGYTVHTGASEDFVAGWDHVFGGKSSRGKSTGARSKKKETAARSASTGKKPSRPKKKK